MSKRHLVSKEIVAEIGPQLKQLRIKRGLTLEELQTEAHISIHLLKRIETGKCLPYSYMWRLFKFYDVKARIVLE